MNVPIPQIMSFPLGGIDADGRLRHAREDESVRQSILNILLTRPGERLMRPQFGAGLLDFVHQPNNQTTRALIASLARKAVAQWETRVSVTEVLALPDPDDPSLVHIEIRYRLLHSPVPRELGLSLDLGTLPVGAGRATAGQARAG
ncbi:MAG: GPW/gp25 family protein [Chromatiaceae bacterium]|jgi:phage baseplate assembly protein W